MIDFLLFFLRYIPFWAVPLLIVSAEFAYIYWLKSHVKISIVFSFLAIICLISIGYYFWAGTPERAARLIVEHLI
ncbi:MAG: hypothetical protein KAQ98_10995 [Bacteriovoracaceae bacterium]|nr:hypothetical protein [Bacteriovoracaceae bacterium]